MLIIISYLCGPCVSFVAFLAAKRQMKEQHFKYDIIKDCQSKKIQARETSKNETRIAVVGKVMIFNGLDKKRFDLRAGPGQDLRT